MLSSFLETEILADLISATDNLKKLDERRSELIVRQLILQGELADIQGALDNLEIQMKQQIKGAKQAAQGLKE